MRGLTSGLGFTIVCWIAQAMIASGRVGIQRPFVIFGPPGTGKTLTLVETIVQVLVRGIGGNVGDDRPVRVLATAPSFFGADLLARRLADIGKDKSHPVAASLQVKHWSYIHVYYSFFYPYKRVLPDFYPLISIPRRCPGRRRTGSCASTRLSASPWDGKYSSGPQNAQ